MRIDGQKARELVISGAQLLDVRSPFEVAEQSLPGAKNIPLNLLPKYHPLLDKGRPVIIYCRSGNRSASAAELLKSNGFNTVYDLGSMRNYFHC